MTVKFLKIRRGWCGGLNRRSVEVRNHVIFMGRSWSIFLLILHMLGLLIIWDLVFVSFLIYHGETKNKQTSKCCLFFGDFFFPVITSLNHKLLYLMFKYNRENYEFKAMKKEHQDKQKNTRDIGVLNSLIPTHHTNQIKYFQLFLTSI